MTNADLKLVEQGVEQESDLKGLGPDIMKDCFVALTVIMLKEPFMSSEIKHIILLNTVSFVRKTGKYSEEQILQLAGAFDEIKKTYMTTNSFMG